MATDEKCVQPAIKMHLNYAERPFCSQNNQRWQGDVLIAQYSKHAFHYMRM